MMKRSHRERVLAALNHEEPDRVPFDLMGNATMILDAAYFELRDYLGLAPIEPVRKGASANYYDERILEYFDVDFRRIFLSANSDYSTITEHADGTFSDVWSVLYKKEGIYVHALTHPLCGKQSVQDMEEYGWPEAETMFRLDDAKERAEYMYRKTDYAIVARNPFTGGFIDRACQLMGTEFFLVSMIDNPGTVRYVLDSICAIYCAAYSFFLDAVGPYVHMVETADDIGTQNSLLISPEHYRQFIKPLDQKLCALIREKAPEAAVFRHTDGAVFPLINDFIDIGIHVLNPVQTSAAGMDGALLKQTYGQRITFHGAIESVGASPDVIEEDVKQKMKIFKPYGGYVFAPCNHIVDAKPQSIIRLFAAAEKYGTY